jgi:putative spermidine/putrescine transport system substrate-binding protein
MIKLPDIGRRDLLGFGGALVASPLLSGVAKAQQKIIVFNDSGGASADAAQLAYGGPLEKATGAKLRVTAPASVAKLKAMLQSQTVEWDVAELVSQEHRTAIREGMLEKLDTAIVDTSNLTPDCRDEYSVVFALYSTALGYSTRIPAERRPKNWGDFWDVAKFPGRRSLRNHPVDNLEFALMADGVAPDKLYPIDLDRAFASLDRLKKHVAVWWRDGAQPAQMLLDGEVDFASGWHGRFFALAQKGETRIGVEWTGAMLKRSWVGVPKGAKNPKEAMQLISIMIQPANCAKYAEGIGYICGDPRAYALVPDPVKEWVMINPAIQSKTALANEDWWLDNGDIAQRRWNDWIVS